MVGFGAGRLEDRKPRGFEECTWVTSADTITDRAKIAYANTYLRDSYYFLIIVPFDKQDKTANIKITLCYSWLRRLLQLTRLILDSSLIYL